MEKAYELLDKLHENIDIYEDIKDLDKDIKKIFSLFIDIKNAESYKLKEMLCLLLLANDSVYIDIIDRFLAYNLDSILDINSTKLTFKIAEFLSNKKDSLFKEKLNNFLDAHFEELEFYQISFDKYIDVVEAFDLDMLGNIYYEYLKVLELSDCKERIPEMVERLKKTNCKEKDLENYIKCIIILGDYYLYNDSRKKAINILEEEIKSIEDEKILLLLKFNLFVYQGNAGNSIDDSSYISLFDNKCRESFVDDYKVTKALMLKVEHYINEDEYDRLKEEYPDILNFIEGACVSPTLVTELNETISKYIIERLGGKYKEFFNPDNKEYYVKDKLYSKPKKLPKKVKIYKTEDLYLEFVPISVFSFMGKSFLTAKPIYEDFGVCDTIYFDYYDDGKLIYRPKQSGDDDEE